MKIIRPALTVLLSGSFVAFVSCKSKEEKLNDKALERHADALEDQAKIVKKDGDRAAEQAKDDAAAKEKALKDAAKETREQK